MRVEPFTTLSWAYQLHHYLCFRTHKRQPLQFPFLEDTLSEICLRHDYKLLGLKLYANHVRCLLSLKPNQSISDVVLNLKANSSRQLKRGNPLWQRGYLAHTIGRVSIKKVQKYIEEQAEHHGYCARLHPPVFRYRASQRVLLSAAHSTFELTYHLVFATQRRFGIFDSTLGEQLAQYWLEVALKRGFAIDRVTIVPDHAHLLVRTVPKMSIEDCALSLMNNGQYFVAKREPNRLIDAGINQLWQASAYAGTAGQLTTALMKKFLAE